MQRKPINWTKLVLTVIVIIGLLIYRGIENGKTEQTLENNAEILQNVPEYDGDLYCVLNNNEPGFTEDDMTTESYEFYSELDHLGRCGTAMASIGEDLMPTEERESISEIKPTGWHSVMYDNVEQNSLYNRSHLIAFQLAGENANEKNLITGTRCMNAEGMLPFEEAVGNYVRRTGNHVLYRVTPHFEGDNLFASGVQMEAYSVEDDGYGICFNVYVYNVQPGIIIDYTNGDSKLESVDESEIETYILNTNSQKFHLESCDNIDDIQANNRDDYTGTREDLIAQGYEPCGGCNP